MTQYEIAQACDMTIAPTGMKWCVRHGAQERLPGKCLMREAYELGLAASDRLRGALVECTAERNVARRRGDELEAVLKPFAACAEMFATGWSDSQPICGVELGDYRRAAEAMERRANTAEPAIQALRAERRLSREELDRPTIV